MPAKQTYIALLRGINVGGHHKVPMADLRREMELMGFENVITLLNSGNVIFDADPAPENKLEGKIAKHLEKIFGFSIPVLLCKAEDIKTLIVANPFKDVEVNKDIRLYITFLKKLPDASINLPRVSEDQSFKIIHIQDKAVFSILDLGKTTTPKGMGALENLYGKNITTRNWKTLNRIAGKLK